MKNQNNRYTIGLDYGTDSARAIFVDCANGDILYQSVFEYTRWKNRDYCNEANFQFRQHPLDYIEALESVILDVVKQAGDKASHVAGIGIDTTGSTPAPADALGFPLSMGEDFQNDPDAMFFLWKDHSATSEAEEITSTSKSNAIDYTQYIGGVYSAEWYFAKALSAIRKNSKIREKANHWIECCDFLTGLITGTLAPDKLKRSRCAAGHKAMWHESYGGVPPASFFDKLDKTLGKYATDYPSQTYTSDSMAGNLTAQWAQKLNLSENVKVAVGVFDAHAGAVGAGIDDYTFTRIVGTSTCDILTAPHDLFANKSIQGICGQVNGSVIAGKMGFEAGQSSFGDIFAWFEGLLNWQRTSSQSLLPQLTKEAQAIMPDKNSTLAIDWLNGRRTPFANQRVKAAITGLHLGTSAPAIYRSLLECSAYGAKAIVDQFIHEGISVNRVLALGGIPKKSPLLMQIKADVLNRPVDVSSSTQACALGAAIFGAVAGGVYSSVQEAMDNMASDVEKTYKPNPDMVKIYANLYKKYLNLGNYVENNTN